MFQNFIQKDLKFHKVSDLYFQFNMLIDCGQYCKACNEYGECTDCFDGELFEGECIGQNKNKIFRPHIFFKIRKANSYFLKRRKSNGLL